MFKQPAYIFDLDGTLALPCDRKMYGTDQALCINDFPNKPLTQLTRIIHNAAWDISVILVSGREDTYRSETIAWCDRHAVAWEHLFMRPAGDNRDDRVVKWEIYERDIEPEFDVQMVFDDRPKVVKMWREKGLFVADVGKGVEF